MPGKKLIVFLEGQRIGILQEDISGKHSFIYDADAPAQLSLSMPRRSQPWTGKPIEAYIDGVLPDDPMTRRAIGKQYGVNGNNPFALLSAIGLDCAGGAQFVPPEQIETVKDDPYSLVPISEKEIEQRLASIAGTSDASWQASDEHWSLNGAQDKIALHYANGKWYEAHGTAPTTHIIKPGIHALHEQAFNEYICMKTIGALGIPVAQTTFRMFGETPALVSTRWDRKISTVNGRPIVQRIHQEDFCQATAHSTQEKYQSDGGPSAQDIIQCMRNNNLSEIDIDQFYIALVVNFLIGGTDAHAKNYALLEPTGAKPSFAPLYDTAPMYAYETQRKQRKLAMSIGGEYNYERIELRHWQKLTEPFGSKDFKFCCSMLQTLSQIMPITFMATAINCLQKVSALDQSNSSVFENRKKLIDKIGRGLTEQCNRVESWFA